MRDAFHVPRPRVREMPALRGAGGPAFGIAGLVLIAVLAVCLAAPSFAFATPRPTVTRVSPTSGLTSGGNSVTIYGKYFKINGRSVVTDVRFGATKATNVWVRSATRLTAKAPARSTGVTYVSVTTRAGASVLTWRASYTYKAPAPVVTSVSPAAGPAAGGSVVTVTGTGFGGVSGVSFGGTPAFFLSQSSTSLVAMAPAGAGTVDVRVTTPAGTSVLSSQTAFAYQTAPVVTSVTPDGGPAAGGTAVTIAGTGFTGATAVRFGASAAASFSVTSATSISAVSPAGTGAVPITVVTPQGTSAASVTYTYTAPQVTGVSALLPHPAAGGNEVTITGSGFSGVTSVTFGTNPATIISWTDTAIRVLAPAGTGTVPVTVTTPKGTSAAGAIAEYTYAPTVTALDPSGGSLVGGTSVTVTGTGFTGATAVMFGAVAATSFAVESDTRLTAVAPAYAGVKVVDVTVTTAAGQSAPSAVAEYSYGPSVTAVSPAEGPTSGGSLVTLTGTGLSGASLVMFGSEPAAIISLSDTSITVISPAHESGAVDVVVTTSAGTSPTSANARFTYAGVPSVTGLTPESGPAVGGTTVTITGTDLSGATAVSFGASSATSFVVVSATAITAVAPPGSGTVPVTVVTPMGTRATGPACQYSYAAPGITELSPGHGPAAGGTAVTITGSGFTGASAVRFGATAATSFSVGSDTIITAVAPAGTGTVTVTVTTPQGTSAEIPAAQYAYAPTISAVSPDHGPAAGGNDVTITGTGFLSATSVTFGGVPGIGFHVSSDTSIIITAPASASGGPVDVVVHTADEESVPATYSYAPVITGLAPSHGPESGGNEVVVSGTGFDGVTAVLFGTAPGTITSWSPTAICITAPAGTGVVPVTVQNAVGTSVPVDYTYDAP